ncbi:MAG: aldo/keto reductase [Thermodesulfobacteriaceae bacterium]|nr:aldo/keto reductase [Thermodesulfobacteriaceae bacterium]MCX8042280.1 aldo/keto reductase [Thermodesulfobacteriaceae bacterium]MDW8136717.1 aldo/keto reductase [Thermodesulfobacterium sp.]
MKLKELNQTGIKIPSIGMGTWGIGGGLTPDYSKDEEFIQLLITGLKLGLTLIDTAEMYGAGHTEELVGEAIKNFPREKIFIITKVLPENLRFKDLIKAAEQSLKRLKTPYIDLYLIHAPNPKIPLKESMEAMEKLKEEGLIKFIGVSNFKVVQMEEAQKYLKNSYLVANQVEYNLFYRRIERDILPYCEKRNITVIAYSPLARGLIPKDEFIQKVALKYNKTASQLALNWLIKKPKVIAIPKSSKVERLKEFIGATDWELSKEDEEKILKYVILRYN